MDKLRQQIVFEAARLMFQRQESQYGRAAGLARPEAGVQQRLRPSELPTNREIREELQRLTEATTIPPAAFPAAAAPPATHPPMSPATADPPPREALAREPSVFGRYRQLLIPLSRIQRDRQAAPRRETSLYHSLQVFQPGGLKSCPIMQEFRRRPMHDVGRAIDPGHPVAAGLAALGDSISHERPG